MYMLCSGLRYRFVWLACDVLVALDDLELGHWRDASLHPKRSSFTRFFSSVAAIVLMLIRDSIFELLVSKVCSSDLGLHIDGATRMDITEGARPVRNDTHLVQVHTRAHVCAAILSRGGIHHDGSVLRRPL